MFKPILEIKSKTGVLHFRRWRILSTPWFSIYLHGIYKADSDIHLHDHPWDYLSIILSGSFLEETVDHNGCQTVNLMKPGSSVRRKAEQFHKIKDMITPKVHTLFITKKPRRDWGYNVDGKWMQHDDYRKWIHLNKKS
jgi:CRP-like cAMP-binding protein